MYMMSHDKYVSLTGKAIQLPPKRHYRLILVRFATSSRSALVADVGFSLYIYPFVHIILSCEEDFCSWSVLLIDNIFYIDFSCAFTSSTPERELLFLPNNVRVRFKGFFRVISYMCDIFWGFE